MTKIRRLWGIFLLKQRFSLECAVIKKTLETYKQRCDIGVLGKDLGFVPNFRSCRI